MTQTLRVLVVGFGSIGRRHLANLRRLEPLADVTVWRHQPSDHAASGADRVVHSLDAALAQRPHAALITSPASHHVRTGLELARNDVPLFVEKPLSSDLEDVETLIEECRNRRLTMMVGYQFRFHASLQTMRAAIAAGRIGRPLSFRAEAGQFLPEWRPDANYRTSVSASRRLGGGALLELSHELDLARWLMGDVESVFAQLSRLSDLEIDVEDCAEVSLRFASGATGSVRLDFFRRPARRFCEILGSSGTIAWNASDDSVRIFTSETAQWTTLAEPSDRDRNHAYLAELQHFLDCVRGRAEAAVDGEDGLRVMQIVDAARRSADSGSRVSL